ncbi:MAG: glycosyltransferase, partial [Acidobacteriota bacterium]
MWSVMIPTFNCATFLRETLASVLAQDPGPAQMQIEVVDDRSTKDDPEEVVRELGRGRVAFHRNRRNQGVTANFNSCVARSRG